MWSDRTKFFLGFIAVLVVLVVLIFSNTIRMFLQRNRVDEQQSLITNELGLNEANIRKNKLFINRIKQSLDDLDDDVEDNRKDIQEMSEKAQSNSAGVAKMTNGLSKVHNTLASLKEMDSMLIEKDTKMNAEWMNQFNQLVSVHEEDSSNMTNMIEDVSRNFMYVNVSEENSGRINELEEIIDDAEDKLKYLRHELDTVQYNQSL